MKAYQKYKKHLNVKLFMLLPPLFDDAEPPLLNLESKMALTVVK